MSTFLGETEGLDEIRKEEPSAAIPPMVRFYHHVRSITRMLIMYCGTRKVVSERRDYLGSDTPATAQERGMSVADEMSGFASERSVRFLEEFQTGGSGCDPRYGWRGLWRHWSGIEAGG
jgi:hypothetical protein